MGLWEENKGGASFCSTIVKYVCMLGEEDGCCNFFDFQVEQLLVCMLGHLLPEELGLPVTQSVRFLLGLPQTTGNRVS